MFAFFTGAASSSISLALGYYHHDDRFNDDDHDDGKSGGGIFRMFFISYISLCMHQCLFVNTNTNV